MRTALIAMGVCAACGRGAEPGGAPVAVEDDAGVSDAGADPQLRGEVVALARARLAALTAEAPPLDDEDGALPALGPCTRPAPAARAALATAITRWALRTHPGQRFVLDGPDLRVGCDDPGGVIVDVHADLVGRGRRTGWWWTVRVRGAQIDTLAATSGMAVEDYTDEYDLHTSHDTLVIADLDGDGAREPLIARNVHEGNARSSYTVLVPGKAGPVAVGTHDGALAVATLPSPEPGVVLALGGLDVRAAFRCVTGPAPWASCPAAERVQRHVRARAIAGALIDRPDAPDRDELDRDLALLDVPTATRAALVARARPTTPREAIEDFVARREDDRSGRTPAEQGAAAAAVAHKLGAAISGALGEVPCPAAMAGERAILVPTLARWIAAHDHEHIAGHACGGACKAQAPVELAIRASCVGAVASYWLATWQRPVKGIAELERQGLFAMIGDRVTLIAGGTSAWDGPRDQTTASDVSGEGPGAEGAVGAVDAKFAIAGGAVTALALAPGPRLIAAVDGVVTGDRAGAAELGWVARDAVGELDMTDDSLARTVEGARVQFWRATSAGVTAVASFDEGAAGDPPTDPAARILDGLERDRVAEELLIGATDADLADAGKRAAIVDALRRLGADAALIDRVRTP
ncbi:MAG: hypothetical protein K8W52_32935 [Deltaproteobacteria bacterium]|nr:hypothetical protein [Deltaproteobacteria bacterium]